MSLSEKIVKANYGLGKGRFIWYRDVKQSIKNLKERLGDLDYSKQTTSEYNNKIIDLIDKEMGDKFK